ncbi:MAG TPA: hypothetical protein VIL46_14260 [Gemmataceae bacterium]
MSSATKPAPFPADGRPQEVVIISHSPYFYWWPLWAVGFLMAAISYATGHQVAFVPPGTTVERGARVEGYEGPRDVLVAPPGRPLPVPSPAEDPSELPRLTMTPSNNPGIIWALTLCLLVVITNIELRGVWTVIALLALTLLAVVFAFFGLWDLLFAVFRSFDIHISAAGYLGISILLLAVWLFTFLLYDRREYMVFSRGQLRVRMAIGTGETAFDTRGMVVEKKRDALFRHWLIGFGSGDLIVQTSGTTPRQFQMPNVLFINSKLAAIHTMLQEREVVPGR